MALVPKSAVYHRYILVPIGGCGFEIGVTFHQFVSNTEDHGLKTKDIIGTYIFPISKHFSNYLKIDHLTKN